MVEQVLAQLSQLHPLIPILIATGLLGAIAGAVGSFTMLRGLSLFGDTMAHAALPGIALIFLLFPESTPRILLLGGIGTSLLGALLMLLIQRTTRLKIDTILGTILSFFFGIGLVLMALLQRVGSGKQAILGKFLFGNATLLLQQDLAFIIIISCCLMIMVSALYKELTAYTFDPAYVKTIGYNTMTIDIIMTLILIVVIGIALQTVGVMLITTLLIAPAAAARQLTRRITSMIFVAGILSVCATVCGTLISYHYTSIPTGPAIIVVATLVTYAILMGTQKRGLRTS